jgi:hypothetical protein
MTGLGREHILLYQLRQSNFSETNLLEEYLTNMTSQKVLELLETEKVHSFESVELILRKANEANPSENVNRQMRWLKIYKSTGEVERV